MNESIHYIPIGVIAPNPYQVRQAEDPVAVAELAANIEKNTLLQPPTVRPIADVGLHKFGGDGCEYEIAFGHTRLAAFRLLAKTKWEWLLIGT
jgi:ParB-like chromosome segregation protein Spo0J